MESEKLKKRPGSEETDQPSSERLCEATNNNSSTKVSSASTSKDGGSNLVDAERDSTPMSSADPCDISIDSETEDLCFMPIDRAGGNHIAKLNAYSKYEQLDNLKSIDIDLIHCIEDYTNQDEEMAEILNRILIASAAGLEKITIRTPVGQLPGLVFPLMPNVSQLQLLFYWSGTDTTNFTGHLRGGQIFPKGFKFSDLPKLEDVVINLVTAGGIPKRFDCWQNNLESCLIAKSVKNIEYIDECEFSKQRLKTTFPNAVWSEISDLNSTDVTYETSFSEEESDVDSDFN